MSNHHRTQDWYLERIQRCLNEISLCTPEEGARVRVLQRKAKSFLRRLKEEYPQLEIIKSPRLVDDGTRRIPSPPSAEA